MRLSQYGVLALVIVFLTTCGITDAYARPLRIEIPKGTIATLSPKSSKSVRAFCLGYKCPAPSAGARLGHVLTASGSAMVQVAGQGAAIPLSQAIAEGIVRVGGGDLDLALRELDAILDNSLKLANLTDKEITISFAETTILSEAPESIADSRVSELRHLLPEELQRQLWVSDNQKHLKELGFFEGDIDGVPDARLLDAHVAFRGALGVGGQNISASAVANLLARASTLHQEAVALGTTPPPRIAVRIEQLESPPPVLLLVASHGKPKGARNAGDNIGDFVDSLVTEAGVGKDIEFDLSGFSTESQANLDALATTIRIRLAAKSPETKSRFSGNIDPLLLVRLDGHRLYPKGPVLDRKAQRWTMGTRLILREPLNLASAGITNFSSSSYYRNYVSRAGRDLVVNVWAKTRDAVVELFRAINRILQREPDLLSLSQEDMARALRKSLEKEQRNIKEGDIELIDALGHTILVEQTQPPAGVRYLVALP